MEQILNIPVKKSEAIFLHNCIVRAANTGVLERDEFRFLRDFATNVYNTTKLDDLKQLGLCKFEQHCSLHAGHAGRCK